MAAHAFGQLMLEKQWVSGSSVVIEAEFFPILFYMTIVASGPKVALVFVVLLMTGIALFGRFLVPGVNVTTDTLHVVMPAQQFVSCSVVIEHNFFPGFF
jgi:hypothetical protein